jgi:hypothetical protein
MLEKITSEELQTLRLDQGSRTEFAMLIKRFVESKAVAFAFDGEDVTLMDDARYDQRSSAEEHLSSNGMAVVHFLAPRIMRLREGTAKRKWRSFLTKFRKEEKLN